MPLSEISRLDDGVKLPRLSVARRALGERRFDGMLVVVPGAVLKPDSLPELLLLADVLWANDNALDLLASTDALGWIEIDALTLTVELDPIDSDIK